ncbi:MAG: amidohydrolase family protein [Gemmatimonadaceae bacterium]
MHPVFMLLSLGLLQAAGKDSSDYVVWNHGRKAGEMQVVSVGDSVTVHYFHIDRQRGPKVEGFYKLSGGRPVWAEIRTGGAQSAAADISGKPVPLNAERFEIRGDVLRYWTTDDTTSVTMPANAFYIPNATTPFDDAVLAGYLLRQPQRSAPIVPTAVARVEIVVDTSVTVGGRPSRVRLAAVHGVGAAPSLVWLDDKGRLFSSGAGWFIAIRRGAEGVLPALRAHELRYIEQREAALAAQFAPKPAAALVIRNGDLFDSESGATRTHMTVVIQRDRITAVGPADSVAVPAGATIIDATGKTIIPGLWDMHTHAFQGSSDGMLQLAAGITTIRDMASDIDVATSLRDRADKGTVLSPRLVLAGFVEGPGKWAGPSGVLVRTEDEARSWVAKYDSLGYKQIKLYNLVHPDLVPTIAAEAHARGMRLSGHVARGLTVPAAVRIGYDEIQHAAFLFSTFFQDSLYYPRMRAYSEVASTVAPTFNVDSPEVTALIGFLRDRGTVIDGTFNIWQDRSKLLPDGTDPVFGPTIDWLSPLFQRGLRAGGGGPTEVVARAQSASAAYRRMLKRLFDAGVTLVPGTDNVAGLSYHGELEIYERAGIPAPNVLQIATITPARVMKMDKDYGSITVGKVADLAIVAGHPSEHITDLRKTETVIRAGRAYQTSVLYDAVGVHPK